MNTSKKKKTEAKLRLDCPRELITDDSMNRVNKCIQKVVSSLFSTEFQWAVVVTYLITEAFLSVCSTFPQC